MDVRMVLHWDARRAAPSVVQMVFRLADRLAALTAERMAALTVALTAGWMVARTAERLERRSVDCSAWMRAYSPDSGLALMSADQLAAETVATMVARMAAKWVAKWVDHWAGQSADCLAARSAVAMAGPSVSLSAANWAETKAVL